MSVELGSQIKYKDNQALVVRKVHSTSLYQEISGRCYTVDEEYLELQVEDGSIAFISLSCCQEPVENKSRIRGLDPQIWRPKNVAQV